MAVAIYHVQIPTIIFLMTIYAKSEQVDISASEICRIISELPDVSNSEKTQDDE
ncbi:hypothetical protein [Phormidium nigroviride]